MTPRPHPARPHRTRPARGLTLVELMVAITVGLVIVAAMSMLFANSSRSRAETERAGIKVDNGRYALDALGRELQHAGFLAEFDPRLLSAPAAKPGACETDINTLRGALALPVLGYDRVSAADLGSSALNCLSDVVPGTDVVVVRRAATCAEGSADCTALVTGAPAFQASSCSDSSEIGGSDVNNFYRLAAWPGGGAFTLRQRDCATAVPLRRYLVRIYYVAANDRDGDGIRSLKRIELGSGGWSAPMTLVQGVDDLQVEWGLDTDNDGIPNTYATNPDTWCAGVSPTPVPAGACWSLPVTAKLFVLARNVEATPGFADAKAYALGKAGEATGASSSSDYRVGPFGDAFKRNVYQRLVTLENISDRRFTP